MPEAKETSYRYEEVIAEIVKQQSSGRNWQRNLFYLIVSLVIFFRLGLLKTGLKDLVIIVVVLFVHEVGHLIGMWLFGYRNVKMLFIPFLGAVVSGMGRNVSTLKKVLVILLGPIPSIIVGLVLLYLHLKTEKPIYCQFSYIFLLINGFNLLPFFPLDGGRFLHEAFFSRNRYLELFFRLLAVVTLIAGGFLLGTWVLWVLGIFNLLLIPSSFKTSRIAEKLKRGFSYDEIPETDEIPPEIAEEIIKYIYQTVPGNHTLQTVANLTRDIWEKLHQRLSRIATFYMILLYFGCFCFCVVSLTIATMISFSEVHSIVMTEIVEVSKAGGESVLKVQSHLFGKLKYEIEVSGVDYLFNGKAVEYFYNGAISAEGQWHKGRKDGEWKYYDKQENLIRVKVYDEGRFVLCKVLKGSRWVEKRMEDLSSTERENYIQEATQPPQGLKHIRSGELKVRGTFFDG